MAKHLAALCFELPSVEGQAAAPATITLIPAPGADGLVRGVDGRTWRMTSPARVVEAFNRARAITENHAGRLAAPAGGSSPAFGWINRVHEQGGAVVGDIAWTPRGEAALNSRDYRFFSPEFTWEDNTTEILAIVGGSLVNDPNFTQLALNRSESFTEQQPMSLKAIALALGLTDTADEAACVTAIGALKTEKQTALNAAQHPDPAKFIPVEQHQVALNRATTAEGELKAMKDSGREAAITAAVDGALAAGQIVPATRDYYLAMCRAEGGLEKFQGFLAVAPVITEPSKTDKKPESAATGAEGLTAGQLAICSAMGLDPKTYAATAKASA